MLTIFSTPKPFVGHIGITQRNAVQSWKRLHPDVEIILFGDEDGAAEIAREFGARWEAEIPRNEFRTPYLNWIFDRAQDLGRHELLCYVNCDIVLTSDFRQTLERVAGWRRDFLMVGRRWDTDVSDRLDFSESGWEDCIRQRALATRRQRPGNFIDYSTFRRGLFKGKVPPFAAGRPGFDNWLVWYAGAAGAAVVDVSAAVVAVHQNHDHSHVPQGERGFWHGEEATRNGEFLEDGKRFGTIDDARYRLTSSGLRSNYRRWLVGGRRRLSRIGSSAWFGFLDLTRPLRHLLGLRETKVPDLGAKDR